MIPRQLYQI